MSSRRFLHGVIAVALTLGALAGAAGVTKVRADMAVGPNTGCSSSSPCVSDSNAGSGPGLASSSAGGSGLTGSTKLVSTSSKFGAGVLGTDSSTSGTFDFGVEGTSTNGTGVKGASTSGTGVLGTSASGPGVRGTTSSKVNPGVIGTSTASLGIGVEGSAPLYGVEGVSAAVGVVGDATTYTGVGVEATGIGMLFLGREGSNNVFSVDSSGNVATANIFSSGFVQSTAGTFISSTTAIPVYGRGTQTGVVGLNTNPSSINGAVIAEGSGGPLFQAINSSSVQVLSVDDAGNLNIAGKIFTSGSCSTGCSEHGPNQRRIVSYVPHESQPTMEDFGRAQLVGGEARVALDPSFANVIDRHADYFVFITPEGDCNGLFVTSRSSAGFVVRELRGGHSSLPFEYRIVAKPYGDSSTRLPAVTLTRAPQLQLPGLQPSVHRR